MIVLNYCCVAAVADTFKVQEGVLIVIQGAVEVLISAFSNSQVLKRGREFKMKSTHRPGAKRVCETVGLIKQTHRVMKPTGVTFKRCQANEGDALQFSFSVS